MRKRFADVYWQIADVQALRPDWPDAQCRQFLDHVADRLRSVMCEAGWGYLSDAIEEVNDE
jgi:hypothetical protein